MVVDGKGGIAVAWDEVVGGRRVAAVRRATVDSARGATFGEVERLATEGASTCPVLAATNNGIVAVWITGGDRSVVKVRTLR